MSVIRIKKGQRKPYVMLDTTALNDPRLSFRAKGLHTYLMSKPDDWQVYIMQLEQISPTEGREAITSAIKELESAGYVQRQRIRGEKGRMAGWHTTIYETAALAQGIDTDNGLAEVGSTEVGLSEVGPTEFGSSAATYYCINQGLKVPKIEGEEENSLTTFESFPGAVNGVHTPGQQDEATQVAIAPLEAKAKRSALPISNEDWPGLTALLESFDFPLPQLNDNSWWNDLSYTCNSPTIEWLEREFAKMHAWLRENPSKAPKTRWKVFVRGWLERSYEKERKGYASSQKSSTRRY